MKTELSGEYLADYTEVTKYLKKHAAKGEKLSEVISDLSELYSDLEAEGASVASVHEGTAEEYAKELLENLPKKKKLSSKAITAILVIIAVLISAIYFTNDSKMAIASRGIERVIKKPEQYSLYANSNNRYGFELYLQEPDNTFVCINSVPWETTPFSVKYFEYSDDDKIYIECSLMSDYQNSEEGSIKIPILYPSLFYNEPEKLIDSIINFDIGDYNIIENLSTGSSIELIGDNGYALAVLYDGYPTYYKINRDGSIDFGYVFEIRESQYSKKTIQEYLLEDKKVYLAIGFVELSWISK